MNRRPLHPQCSALPGLALHPVNYKRNYIKIIRNAHFKVFIIFSINLIFNYSVIASDEYKVKTSSGISIGELNQGVVTWNDIPYAKAPINNLRWMAPRDIFQPEKLLKDLKKITVFKNPLVLVEHKVKI